MPEVRTDTEIIVADVSIEESMAIMCQQGVVILNCVGPVSILSQMKLRLHMSYIMYLCSHKLLLMLSLSTQYRFYGEPVVKACIENGAHYVDICGEPQVMYCMKESPCMCY